MSGGSSASVLGSAENSICKGAGGVSGVCGGGGGCGGSSFSCGGAVCGSGLCCSCAAAGECFDRAIVGKRAGF